MNPQAPMLSNALRFPKEVQQPLNQSFNRTLDQMVTERDLPHDLITRDGLTLGKRFHENNNMVYPPVDEQWSVQLAEAMALAARHGGQASVTAPA